MKKFWLFTMAIAVVFSVSADNKIFFGENAGKTWCRFMANGEEIALTFDACGGKTDACDWRLLNFLIENEIHATLFVSGKWIKEHSKDFNKICAVSLFDIQNHGYAHQPCSSCGMSAYGIKGTASLAAVHDEVMKNHRLIKLLSGIQTRFYRSGTAFYDCDAVDYIRKNLGHEIAGFSIVADAGATFKRKQAYEAVCAAKSGDIIIGHMNHPEKEAALGMIDGIRELSKKYRFVLLKNCKFK